MKNSMGQSVEHSTLGGVARRLSLSPYHSLASELMENRIDPFIRAQERGEAEGRILAFVRGLRLSSRLIYAIRDLISSMSLEVDWGHLLDEQNILCSPECDVIVHKPGYVYQWNGNKSPVMDFKFIDCREAIAVISCKSFISSIDKSYRKKLAPYLDNVLLFAECCEPSAVQRLTRSATQGGYKGFWYLYTWDPKTSMTKQNPDVWLDFVAAIRQVAASAMGG